MQKEGVFHVVSDLEKEQLKTGVVLYSWVVGPRDTPYYGYAYEIRIYLPPEWPVKSPSVAFTTSLMHVNIEINSGAICCNQLNEDYVPTLRLSTMVNIILPQLLEHPNDSDPFNTDAAARSTTDPREYACSVVRHVQAHAIPLDKLQQVIAQKAADVGSS